MSVRIGIDIGGTFTDFALVDGHRGVLHVHKQLTTPHDPARAVLEGVGVLLRKAAVDPAEVQAVIHGTTLVTNALIERRGAKTALLVTAGFADVLDIARERRYDMYELGITYPEPLVPRSLRFEVRERLDAQGRVLVPLDEGEVLDALQRMQAQGVSSVAVCFLHSPTQPLHEQQVARLAARHHPRLHLSLSSEVFPFLREYERWTTATMNAYTAQVFDGYLERLQSGLRQCGLQAELFLMTASGGMVSPALARRFPVRLLESGPAAGVLQSAALGQQLQVGELLAFDMGGTTAKGALVRGGKPLLREEIEVARVHEFRAGSGLPARIPVIDLIEIGSGGGSIAALDVRGAIAVGPRSAGADPGPACYDRGGQAPTLSDANLMLGYLAPDFFLGGALALDAHAAQQALATHIAEPLGVSALRAAWGVHEAVNEDITRAFRNHASERGVDLRRCAMVAFGGSGPAHACRVARKLRVPTVVLPVAAGVMSAVGLLGSPLAFEVFDAQGADLQALDEAAVQTRFERLMAQARDYLGRPLAPGEQEQVRRGVRMRYKGQGHDLEVSLPDGAGRAQLQGLFESAYEAIFGRHFNELPLEVTAWHLTLSRLAALPPVHALSAGGDAQPAVKATRRAWCPQRRDRVPMPVLDRKALRPGDRFVGPLLVEEDETTTVLGEADVLQVHAQGHLWVQIAPMPVMEIPPA